MSSPASHLLLTHSCREISHLPWGMAFDSISLSPTQGFLLICQVSCLAAPSFLLASLTFLPKLQLL